MDFFKVREHQMSYSPEWFQSKYPGFYSEGCYIALANYFNQHHDEPTPRDQNKKRKITDEDLSDSEGVEETKENVPPVELVSNQREPLPNLHGEEAGSSVHSRL